MCIYRYPKMGLTLYVSTDEILKRAVSKMKLGIEKPLKVEIDLGDILKIDRMGNVTRTDCDISNLRSFSYYYRSPLLYTIIYSIIKLHYIYNCF